MALNIFIFSRFSIFFDVGSFSVALEMDFEVISYFVSNAARNFSSSLMLTPFQFRVAAEPCVDLQGTHFRVSNVFRRFIFSQIFVSC